MNFDSQNYRFPLNPIALKNKFVSKSIVLISLPAVIWSMGQYCNINYKLTIFMYIKTMN